MKQTFRRLLLVAVGAICLLGIRCVPEERAAGALGMLAGHTNCILIGQGAFATKDRQLVVTWEDGSELRMDLPTNTWIRGWK